jgi:hypothetical protein
MKGLRYRLIRMTAGTAAVTLGMVMEVTNPVFLDNLSTGWSLTALVVKMLLGAVVVFKGMEQYQRASFPPGDESLQDPINVWVQTQLALLQQKCWPLYFLSMLVLLFTPIFTAVFLPLVLMRPFYTAATSRNVPRGQLFVSELRRTLRFLFAMGKGLLILTLCSCVALAICISIFVTTIYLHHHQA